MRFYLDSRSPFHDGEVAGATWRESRCEDERIGCRGKMRKKDDRYQRKAAGVGKRRSVAQPSKCMRKNGLFDHTHALITSNKFKKEALFCFGLFCFSVSLMLEQSQAFTHAFWHKDIYSFDAQFSFFEFSNSNSEASSYCWLEVRWMSK